MRILSKFNRLTVILFVIAVVGIPAFLGTQWIAGRHQEQKVIYNAYLKKNNCILLGYTKRGAQPVYQCNGILMYSADIAETLAVNAR